MTEEDWVEQFLVVVVRTRYPGPTYELWTGDGWVPITKQEYESYFQRGFSVYLNPRTLPREAS